MVEILRACLPQAGKAALRMTNSLDGLGMSASGAEPPSDSDDYVQAEAG
jgi:hypothetical protein